MTLSTVNNVVDYGFESNLDIKKSRGTKLGGNKSMSYGPIASASNSNSMYNIDLESRIISSNLLV